MEITEIRFNRTSEALKQPGARTAFEKHLAEELKSLVPEIVNRSIELPAYFTAEVGFYTNLMEEARKCYEFGLFHAAVSMIGIAAERFAMELSLKLKLSVNDKQITEKDLYDKGFTQYKRLELLHKGGLITEEAHDLLQEIRDIRNGYIHPSKVGDAKGDSLKLIKKFNEVIQSRFSEKYVFRSGQIVPRWGMRRPFTI